MRRREFIGLVGGAAVWPSAADSQTLAVVGYIHVLSEQSAASTTAGFRRGLSEAGFIEGHNVALEYRYAAGQLGKLRELAEELVNRRVTVIAAMGGSYSALAAKAATSSIPIVFTMGDADPVRAGVVASLARPGGNITGISLLGGILGAKRLEILRELVPTATKIGVLINPDNRNVTTEREELERLISRGGQTAFVVASAPSDDIDVAMARFSEERVHALLVTADPTFTNRRVRTASALLSRSPGQPVFNNPMPTAPHKPSKCRSFKVRTRTTFCDGQHIGLDGRSPSCTLGDPQPGIQGRTTPLSGRKNMSNHQQTCDYCGGPTTFATEIQPLGREPGHQVFFCDPCKRHTWTSWYIPEIQRLKNSRSDTGSQ